MINEAIFALYEGVATRESIDGIMKLGMNHPMGPLQLCRLHWSGRMSWLSLMCYTMVSAIRNIAPCPPVETCYVDAGWLGKKTRPRVL